MLWFGSKKAIAHLQLQLDEQHTRLVRLETDWKAQVAALENAADLYNRAAARRERSKPHDDGDPGKGLLALRERRGGF